ncbi:MAG: SPASM domain-containing protein [Bacteroidia bacterium]|nr:SPASM domain-containing protein [Bacteroidia bacterium]
MTLRTARNLLRCVTARRVWNLLRIFVSFRLSAWTSRSIVWGLPYTLTIEPTNRCNLKCPECPSGNGAMTRPQGLLSMDRFSAIVEEVAGEVFYLQLFFQGEPFINNRLADMLRHAHERRMYTAVSTNAHYLRPEVIGQLLDAGLDRLIVSIDGMTQEVYEEYRVGGSLERALDAVRSVDAERRKRGRACHTELVLQMLVTKQSEAHIPRLKDFARSVHAETELKTMQVYGIDGAERFLPDAAKWRRYDIVNGALRIRGKMHNRCVRLWERSVITWDGTVVPCCFDKDAEYPLGSLDDMSFKEIWQSGPYHDFRHRILRGRRNVEMCRNCTEGLRIYR